jgi:nucleoside-diphosphate-sugar epimerase
VGKCLAPALVQAGHDIRLLTRGRGTESFPPEVRIIEGDPTQPGKWQLAAKEHFTFINLAMRYALGVFN